MARIRSFGLAGTLSYVLTELVFWAVALPGAALGYHATTGTWLSWDTDRTQLAGIAAAFVGGVRFAVPIRMGVALAAVPFVQSLLDAAAATPEAEATAPTRSPPSASLLAALGAAAAARVQPSMCVALGSGLASEAFVRALGARLAAEGEALAGVTAVASSLACEELARQSGVPLVLLNDVQGAPDLCVLDADELDPAGLHLLTGSVGGVACQKMVAWRAREVIVLVGEGKLVEQLGQNCPVYVDALQFGLAGVEAAICELGGRPERRSAPDGSALVTDEGHASLACFFGPLDDARALEGLLCAVPGVVGTGIFCGVASEAMVVHADGRISTLKRKPPMPPPPPPPQPPLPPAAS